MSVGSRQIGRGYRQGNTKQQPLVTMSDVSHEDWEQARRNDPVSKPDPVDANSSSMRMELQGVSHPSLVTLIFST
eukprot:68679-Pelagomonas_calceolata.AAC.3